MKKYNCLFFQVPTRNVLGPLYLAVHHTDVKTHKGIIIYFSTRVKYPSEETHESSFHLCHDNKRLLSYISLGKAFFKNDFTYFSVFCRAKRVDVTLCVSLSNTNSMKILNDKLLKNKQNALIPGPVADIMQAVSPSRPSRKDTYRKNVREQIEREIENLEEDPAYKDEFIKSINELELKKKKEIKDKMNQQIKKRQLIMN